MRNFIIYGGTFDPIHNGHLKTAFNIQDKFCFDRFVFLPCKIPVLKDKALATPQQRIDMLRLALCSQDSSKHFAIDLSEINRDSPSYMVDTLKHFRQKFGEELAITLVMGTDTFNQLPRWHAWQQLLSLTNLLVIKRAGVVGYESGMPQEVKDLLAKHETQDGKQLCQYPHGLIYRYDAGQFEVSSSWIRQQIRDGKIPEAHLATAVLQYIKENNLYSATE